MFNVLILTLFVVEELAIVERKSLLTLELCEAPLSLDTLELSYKTSDTSSFMVVLY